MSGTDRITPIAIFVYNRPDHTRRLLESLIKCDRLDVCPVLIFCDGPKDESQAGKVHAVRTIIHNFAEKNNPKIIEADKNLGLNTSIVNGVSQVIEDYGRAIILEDDLILHPCTLDFMIQALDRYENDPRVGHVSGFAFPIKHDSREDALFLPLFNSWGWATWERSWKNFEWSPDKAMQEMNKDSGLRKRMYPYYDMFVHFYKGNIMVWDLLWHWKFHSLNKLGVFPSASLIWCSGFDETATHTTSIPKDGYQSSYEQVMTVKRSEYFRFPDQVTFDPHAVQALNKFLHSMYGSPLKRIYRKMRDSIKETLKDQKWEN
jgi:hypothetical protein